jgi:threonine/homoserine/homoserine lactone efflux protein
MVSGPGFHSGPLFCFLGGILLSAVNPLQIPFWFGWSTILLTKKILLPRADHYNTYIAGIGLGTFAGNGVFIFGGHYFVNSLFKYQNILNWVIGGVFLMTALFQADRILSRKNASRKL